MKFFLFVLSIFLPYCIFGGSSGDVRGKKGTLHPPGDNNSTNYNNEKLMVVFDPDCAGDYNAVKKNYKNLIKDFGDCLYENKHKHKHNIYYTNKTQTYHAYIMIKMIDCVDDINITYNDYCIEEFDYEEVFTPDASCTSQSPYLWNQYHLYNTDIIDGSNDNTYNYVTDSNNIIDIYVLDTGVLSTHDEFDGITVTHLDNINDNDITANHGTHVAGTAAGNTVGIFKHASNIYSFTACPSNCPSQDVEDALEATIDRLSITGRRGVINLSLGSFGTTSNRDWYESYFDQIIDNGGIPVCSAGNDGEQACDRDDGQVYKPGTADNCICVGSYDENYAVAWDSNYGECVDVYAPGVSVISGTHTGDSSYVYKSGTSMAAPAITGLVANLLYVNNDLTFTDIFTILTDNDYATSLSDCDNDDDEGNCNGIGMTCNEVIDAAGTVNDWDSDGYTCSDGCTISNQYINDNYCDCADCGDENEWTCNECGGCPSCGSWIYCGAGRGGSLYDANDVSNLAVSSNNDDDTDDEKFTCNNGCQISMSSVNDGSYCDCSDCSDEDNWSCESCEFGCPSDCDAFTYCWSTNEDSSISSVSSVSRTSHDTEAVVSSGSGVHCGCNNEDYDTLTISNLNTAIHGNEEVYDFNNDWTLISGCMNGQSYFKNENIYNNVENDYESFILYYTGGMWVITKESDTSGYWAGCPQSDIFNCFGLWWVNGNNGYDTDSTISTSTNYVCTSSSADTTESYLSVSLDSNNDDSLDSSSSSSSTSSNVSEWGWLFIGIGICIFIAVIIGAFCYWCTNYTIVKQQDSIIVNSQSYNLMKD